MSLNSEPSQPEEREAYDLPPKSYLDALVEEPNGTPLPADLPKTNGTHEAFDHQQKINGSFDATEVQQPEPQPEVALEDSSSSQLNGSTHTPNEYIGTGLDSLPRSPTRKGHGHSRKSSRQHNSPKQERQEKHSENENNIVYEKFTDRAGDRLISVKPNDEWEKELRLDKREKKPQSQAGKDKLASGRQAGTGWDRSA